MKNHLTLALVTISLTAGYAQESKPQKEKIILIGLSYAPTSQTVFYNSYLNGNYQNQSYNSYASTKGTFKVGIPLLYKIQERLSIETGAYYSKRALETIPTEIIDDILGFIGNEKNNYKATYIEIPIGINYFFINKKISLFGALGVNNNVLLSQKNTSTQELYSGNTTIVDVPVNGKSNSYAASIYGGFGLDFNIKKIKIRLEPIYNRFITPYNIKSFGVNNNVYKTKSYYVNYNLNLSVFYTL